MKVKLTLPERYTLIDILPQKGDIDLMRRACELRDVLLPTEAEDGEFGIVREPGAVGCNKKGRTEEREIEVGQTMRDKIIAKLTALSKEGNLVTAHVPLYEKFVAATTEDPAEKGETPSQPEET